MTNIKSSLKFSRFKKLFTDFITSLSIFATTVFFTPDFKITSFPILILSSITVSILEYLISIIIGIENITLGRGVVGFTCAVLIIYITQFFVEGYYISIISSIIAATIYAIIDTMLSNEFKYDNV